jgi:predicted dehydrogenase
MCTLGRFVVQAVNKADDTATLVLIYPDKTVNLYLTYAAAGQPWSERRHVWGEHGSIHVQVEASEPVQVWQQGNQVPQAIEHEAANWWTYSVKLGLKAALDCFRDDQPFLVTPQDAREVLKVIRAAYHSADLKRQVLLSEVEQEHNQWQ